MPQKGVPCLLFSIDRIHIEQVTEFNFLGLIIDSYLNWKAHLSAIGTKISRVIGLLHKLRYIFHETSTALNILFINHATPKLFTFGVVNKVPKNKTTATKAIRVLYFKFPIAYSEPVFL